MQGWWCCEHFWVFELARGAVLLLKWCRLAVDGLADSICEMSPGHCILSRAPHLSLSAAIPCNHCSIHVDHQSPSPLSPTCLITRDPTHPNPPNPLHKPIIVIQLTAVMVIRVKETLEFLPSGFHFRQIPPLRRPVRTPRWPTHSYGKPTMLSGPKQ